jgi:hypothetical protein
VVESYDRQRYFTVTGQHLEGTPTAIEDRNAVLEVLHGDLFPATHTTVDRMTQVGGLLEISDEDVLSRAAYHEKFEPLWQGYWRGEGFPSPSEADLSLCAILVQHAQDPAQIDRLFRQSGLYREKWDRPDYAKATVQKAVAGETQQYPIFERGVFKPITAADLLALELPPTKWVIPGLVPEGLMILAGRPKVGKSWLAMNLPLAVAGSGPALGKIELVDTGGCLYLALEDAPERLKSRIEALNPCQANLSNLHLQRELKPLHQGGLSEVHEWLLAGAGYQDGDFGHLRPGDAPGPAE